MQETTGVAELHILGSMYTSPDPPVGPGVGGCVEVFGGRGGSPHDDEPIPPDAEPPVPLPAIGELQPLRYTVRAPDAGSMPM